MPENKKPSDVRRVLSVATPTQTGPDVTRLQRAVNQKFDHFKIDRQIRADGEFGPQTLAATKQIALAMGATRGNHGALRKGRVTESVQRLVRGQREKTFWEKAATKARAPYRRILRGRYDKSAGEKVMEWAKYQVGITENPPGSNWGGRISEWIKFTGYGFAVYWCGCFACYGVVKIGGAKIPTRIRLGYDQYIIADAKAGTNGLVEVPFGAARAGDIVVFDFAHIGLVDRVVGDTLYTVEGNTSSGDTGSQSNGGGVYARVRNKADVALIARPNY